MKIKSFKELNKKKNNQIKIIFGENFFFPKRDPYGINQFYKYC